MNSQKEKNIRKNENKKLKKKKSQENLNPKMQWKNEQTQTIIYFSSVLSLIIDTQSPILKKIKMQEHVFENFIEDNKCDN